MKYLQKNNIMNISNCVGLLSAIASFVMVAITWKNLKQNREQLEELKRQWKEEHTPKLIVTILKDICGLGYYLKVENAGNYLVRDISFKCNDEFINECKIEKLKERLKVIGDNKFDIKANSYKKFYLCTLDSSQAIYAIQRIKDDKISKPPKECNINIFGMETNVEEADNNYRKLVNIPLIVKIQLTNNEVITTKLSLYNYEENEDSDIVHMLKKINETLKNNGTR